MGEADKYIDDMGYLVEDALLKLDEPTRYDAEKDQPEHFSWFHVWWSAENIFSDYSSTLEYADAEEFQQQLVEAVRAAFNTNTLQYIRESKIDNFGMQIGPHSPHHADLNEELGLKVKRRKEE